MKSIKNTIKGGHQQFTAQILKRNTVITALLESLKGTMDQKDKKNCKEKLLPMV